MSKLFLITASLLFITACKQNQSNNSSQITEFSKTTVVNNKDNFEDIIASEFNSKNKMVKVSKTDEVVSSDIQESHTEYKIEPVDSEYLNQIREANDRIYSNQGTDEDKVLIKNIRLTVKEFATQLDNDLDAIIFNYPDEEGNIMIVAISQKDNDIIPID